MSAALLPTAQVKDDYATRLGHRRALRERIEKYRDDDPYKPKGPLDSSLKKHTTLLNKLRSALLSTPAATLIKEIDGLTLGKYLEEIVGAVVEGVGGSKGGKVDIDGAEEVVIHLHSRLTPTFLPSLLPSLLSLLATANPTPSVTSEKDDKDRITRLRPVLRIVAELALVGAWEDVVKKGVKVEEGSAGAEEVLKVVQNLMNNDPQYTNIPLLTTFLKSFQRAYLGTTSLSTESESSATTNEEDELVPGSYREKFRKMFSDYFKNAGKVLVKGHTRLLEQDKRNHEAYIKSGEIFEDRQQAYEKMTKAVERLQGGVQSLADLLGLSAPALPTASSLSKTSLQIVDGSSSFFRSGEDIEVTGGIWDEEEDKKFYEDIIDLADEVPAALLGLGNDGQKIEPTKLELDGQVENPVVGTPPVTVADLTPLTRTTSTLSQGTAMEILSNGEEDEGRLAELDTKADEEAEPIQSGPAARLNAIFAALPEASNRSLIDKLAVEFAFLNSKGARKRMWKFLGAVPKSRTDLLPHYARFAATLNRYMPDIGAGLISVLDEEFKYLQRKKLVKELDYVRIKNVRYFGELAKFKVAQTHTIMHCLKVFLEDLTGPNIDMAAMLLESCGRFLLRNEATSDRMKSMLDLLRRKQGAQHFDARQQLLLENAFYQCNPPIRQAKEEVQLSPPEAFIQHLIHDVLAKKTIDKVLRLLRKLHWEESEVYTYLFRVFTEVWEVKFGSISLLAMIVYDLQRYHPEFAISVLDQVLEDLKVGMEANIFEYHQRRISNTKYLGELYMYRVISTPIIFETLWQLISYGHVEGLPVPGRSSPIDAADDFFRIRLVCTLLDTCGTCFDKGSNKKKLDHFLIVFQLYVLCKAELPTDIHFMISDTFETIRPKMTPFKTFQEAALAVDELMQTNAQPGVDDDEIESEEEGSDAGGREGGEDEEDEDMEVDGQLAGRIDDDEDEDVVLLDDARHTEYDQEAEDAFNKEFAKMLADTTETRRLDRKAAPPVFDMAVPLIKRAHAPDDGQPSDGKHMQFALLSKKGNKQQIRTLDVPIDSALAVNTRTHQMHNKQEQEQLKKLVLANERRQEQSEKAALEQSMRNRGIRLRYAPD